MSKKDRELIMRATCYADTEWDLVDDLIEVAESERCKDSLRQIQKTKFRLEEFNNGSL